MNKVYRIVWSTATSSWVVASEFARGDARGATARPRMRRGALASTITMLLACRLLTIAQPALAQVYWDGNDVNANANGGSGTWQTGSSNWDSAASAGGNVAWANALDAVFGGSAGTVTIAAGGVVAHNLTFNIAGYGITGGTLTLDGANATINTATGNTNITAVIAGDDGLIKEGSGTLQLNADNSYTGVTQVRNGTLLLNHAGARGDATNDASNLLMSSGTGIQFFGGATYAHNLTASGTFTVSGQSAIWSGTPTLTSDTLMNVGGLGVTLSGNLSDNGGVLSVTSGGNVILSGANTYTGRTRITGNTLTLGASGALPNASNLEFAGTTNAFLALNGNFARTLGTGANQVQWTGSGGFYSSTTGTKTVDLGANVAWGTTPGFLPATASFDVGASSGTVDFVNNLALPTAGTHYVVHAIGTLASHAVFSGAITGAGNLSVTGAVPGFNDGVLELSGNNSYTGTLILNGTAVDDGNVLASSANALSPNGVVRFDGSATNVGSTVVLGQGDFTRALGTGANQVHWTGNGGFSASGANRSVNIGGAGATLTWNVGGFVPTNRWLVLAGMGNAEVDFQNDIDLGGAVRTIAFSTGGSSRISGDLSNGGVLYRGSGNGTLSGASTYTGVTTIGVNGTSSTTAIVSSIGNGGTAGNLGAASNAAGNLVLASGTISYVGAGETTDRNITIAAGNGSLQGNGSGAVTWNGVTSTAGANTLFLSGNGGATISNRVGMVSNGAGTLSIDKTGTGTWRLDGANTYTGTTRVSTGVLEVSNLANGGIASSLGASSSAAANLVGNGGTLRYVGSTDATTDRAIQLANNFRLESSGTGTVRWNAPTLQIATASPVLTLAGSNTGHNSLGAALLNIATATNVNQNRTSLTKTGKSTWWIEGTGAGYTGNTTITDGMLVAATNSGINGGFGTTSNSVVPSGYTSTNAGSSLILFNGGIAEGGVLALTADSGPFMRNLTTAATSFNANAPGTADDNFIHGVRWMGHGGFAAFDGVRVVDIGGLGATLSWNSGGFVTTGSNLILGSAAANGTVDFRNGVAMQNAVRTIETRDGSAAVDAILSGVLSSGGASGALTKTGTGTLALTGNNTLLSGVTNIQAGTLQVGNGGTSGSIGASSATVAAGAKLAVDRSDTLTFTNVIGGAGTLRQQGTGTTRFAVGRTIGGVEVVAGTLDLDAGMTTQTLLMGAGTLRVGGTMQASGGDANVVLSGVAGTASTVDIESGATLRASGTLGDGDDVLRVAGTLATATGVSLGDGNDSLQIVDGASVGELDGGTGNDTATANLAGTADVLALKAFESLTKTNVGVLRIDGPATTMFDTVDVQGGTLALGASGRLEGATSTTVAQGATLQVDGAFTGSTGDDLLYVAGTVGGGGNVALGAGRDTLHLVDGAHLSARIDGGDGADSLVAEIAGAATLGQVLAFESLQKHGAGALTSADAQSFAITDVHAGTLAIAAGTTFASQATMVAAGATLDVAGTFAGTAGDDTFTSSGTLAGSFDFAAGNDRVWISGGPNQPLQLEGGTGDDTLVFDATALDDTHVARLRGWERMSLEHGSTLTLATAMGGVDLLALDATSSLIARRGAALAGSLANDGTVRVESARLAITGAYAAGANASLFVTVSPGTHTAGGLDIGGDVVGVTPVTFASDGSTGGSTASILVIDSPNDVRGNGGFTIAGSNDGLLRLQGSPFAWTFGQADDNRWYLDTDAKTLTPEVAGDAILAAVGFDTTCTAQQALFGHLDAVRGSPDCARDGGGNDASHRTERSDCSGLWVSTIGTETRVDAGPGFAYSGDVHGLFVGMDGTVADDERREIRVGAYAGAMEGNWWTTGASTGPITASDANVRLEGPAFGAYGELLWSNGTYASASLVRQRHDAEVIAHDGFRQRIDGASTSLVQQLGWKRAVEHGWSLEPQLQAGITRQHWDDIVDASGKALTFHDDTLGHVRAALRVDRAIRAGGSAWRPWFSVGLEDTFGEERSSVSVAGVALPNEQVGQRWTFDAGVEATLREGVTLFGAFGVANEINGTSKETRQARVGLRWSW